MNDLFDLDEVQKKNDSLARVRELEKLIFRYQKSYYDGEGEISDEDFDALWDELKELDPDNELLKKIGSDSGTFEKSFHIMPMGSQEKAANPEQFLAWTVSHPYSEYLVEYKLDGASLELQYKNGRLDKAVTRGDGSVGDVITENAKKMKGVLHALNDAGGIVDFTGGVRGEVIMTHDVHKKLYSDKANCRNAANGLMRRKSGEGSENLMLIVYDALSSDGENPFSDEEEKILWLGKMGFFTVPIKICKSPEEVIDYRSKVMGIRKSLDYDIDGLVVKERVINLEDARRNRPDRQIAFKFSLEEALSTLRNVEWSQNGSTYTPVAIFDEVELNGTKVQRASLSNPDVMRLLGIKIGCKVVVVKRGEIIPKIEYAIHEEPETEREVEYPSVCETCSSVLVDDGSRLYCPNKTCQKRMFHQITKWVQCVDIRDLGDALLENLFDSGRVRAISDLYTLTEEELSPFFLNEESLSKEKKSLGAQKVLSSIQNHREIPLSSFVAGFDIEGFGETTVEKLVRSGYDSLEKLLVLKKEDIEAVYGFAEKMALSIVQGFSDNKSEMLRLSEKYVMIKKENGGSLAGKSFCFTGELRTMNRLTAEKMVKELGATCKSSVTRDLSYLVTNDTESGSSKNLKAKKLGIPVISEDEFIKIVGK